MSADKYEDDIKEHPIHCWTCWSATSTPVDDEVVSNAESDEESVDSEDIESYVILQVKHLSCRSAQFETFQAPSGNEPRWNVGGARRVNERASQSHCNRRRGTCREDAHLAQLSPCVSKKKKKRFVLVANAQRLSRPWPPPHVVYAVC